jgi:translation initiation factor 2B subunit (eIF-2B alpha/beta/delta family)
MALQKYAKDPALEQALIKLAGDHRSGATAVARAVLRLVEKTVGTAAEQSATERQQLVAAIFARVIAAHPQMGILYYLNEMFGNLSTLDPSTVRKLIRETVSGIREQQCNNALAFAAQISRGARIITVSSSSAVAWALIQAAPKKIQVIIAESRPKNEGRALARKLHDQGLAATLIVDAALGLLVSECDVVLVGADAVTPEYFVNKIGTLALCRLARDNDTPVFVLSDTYRLLKTDTLPRRQVNHPAREVVAGAQPYAVDNRYFDFIPLKLAVRIICNGRILTPGRLF